MIIRRSICAVLLGASVLAGLMFAGCVAPPRVEDPGMAQMHGEPKLKPGFSVNISVMVGGVKEVDEQDKRITAKGTLSLPLLGEVPAAPLTLKELSVLLDQMYSQYFVKPKVSVEFSRVEEGNGMSPWGAVTVMGRVVKPGKVNVPPTRDLTVSRAIQKSGGFSSSANQSSIKITRRLRDGTLKTIKVNMKSLGAGNLDEDVLLYPGDVIFIPERIL